jgi:hypothetical protein
MDLEYKINESIGLIKFGDHRNDVRQYFSNDYKSFYKTPFSKIETDFFPDLGIITYYDSNYCCEYVEIIKPSNVVFNGFKFLSESYSNAKSFLINIDSDYSEEEDGITFYNIGIVLYGTDIKNTHDRIPELIAVFKKGYYDENL